MSLNRTQNARLYKPDVAERNWNFPLNANVDILDGMSAIGYLLVTTAEEPSTSLNVRATAGAFQNSAGQVMAFGGSEEFALPANSTTCLWLDDAGQLQTDLAFPSTPHVRLASVTTSSMTVTRVRDERVQLRASGVIGGGSGGLLAPIEPQADTTADLTRLSVSSTTEAQTLYVDGEACRIGFFGASPASQAPAVAALQYEGGGQESDHLTTVGSIPIDQNFVTLASKLNQLIAVLQRHGLMGR